MWIFLEISTNIWRPHKMKYAAHFWRLLNTDFSINIWGPSEENFSTDIWRLTIVNFR